MHRLFVPRSELQPGSTALLLEGAQARYLSSVLRLGPGAALEIFDGEGGSHAAIVRASAPDAVELELGERRVEPAAALDVVLAQALAKGDKLDLVVQKATELGVRRIVPLQAERSVVRLDRERGASRAERWRRIAQEASRQCGRSDVPTIDEPRSWAELFAALEAEPDRRALLLDPKQTSLRLSAAARGQPKLLIAIGPEGGFSPGEQEQAVRAGMLPVGLGPRVLRTETVALAALAVVLHVAGELG